MIDFMVIGLPRSGTTWAANWLTTDDTICLHDPLFEHHYAELDAIPSAKRLGLSCTGLWCFPEYVNAHTAKKVILHRPASEVNRSLAELGYPALPAEAESLLRSLNGLHVDWLELFEAPDRIHEHLLDKPFDAERHAELKKMRIQPEFGCIQVDRAVTRRLLDEMKGE